MQPIAVSELNIRRVSAAYRQRVQLVCPDLLPIALRVLDRLEPERWTLEWYLPWWLGEAFELGPDLSYEFVLSNVLGLASIRLEDDLVDGDVHRGEIADATTLSAVLYEEAVAVYRDHFDRSSPFWVALSGFMSEWRTAIHQNDGHAGPSIDAEGGSGRLDLGRRGAPLKIAALGMCLLADRSSRFPQLEDCLDHALAGLVLYDHFMDWEDDLAAGRWNTFIADSSTLPQTTRNRARNRSSVLLAMMTADAAATHFAVIQEELSAAIVAADLMSLAPLANHLRRYAAQTADQGLVLQSHYRDLAERATNVMFASREPRPRLRGGAVT
jgi:hypothetical protein